LSELRINVVFMGGQYNHLIARALREIGAESKIVFPTSPIGSLMDVDGLVMGGGPHSVYDGMERFGNAPEVIAKAQFPLLGICLSHQLIGKVLGGDVVKGKKPEYGKTVVEVLEEDDILKGVGRELVTWASHNDEVRVGEGKFIVLAKSEYCDGEALKDMKRQVYGVQFHVEVAETPKGKDILRNFAGLCKK